MGGVKPIEMKRATIVVETSRLIEDPNVAKNLIGEFSLPGDGHAAERIVQAIRCHFGLSERPGDYIPKVTDKPAQAGMIQRDLNTHAQSTAGHQASGIGH